MTLSERIVAYVRDIGPATSTRVAQDLSAAPRHVSKLMSQMAAHGILSGTHDRPRLYTFVREPVPVAERLRRAREVYSAIRPTAAHESHAERARVYRSEHREAVNAKRRERYARRMEAKPPKELKPAKVKAVRAPKPAPERLPRIPKPKPIKPEQVKVKPSRRIKEDGAFAPAAMIQRPIDRAGLPDTDAFLRANPSALIRLKPGESSQPRERLTREQRQNILGLKVAVAA